MALSRLACPGRRTPVYRFSGSAQLAWEAPIGKKLVKLHEYTRQPGVFVQVHELFSLAPEFGSLAPVSEFLPALGGTITPRRFRKI